MRGVRSAPPPAAGSSTTHRSASGTSWIRPLALALIVLVCLGASLWHSSVSSGSARWSAPHAPRPPTATHAGRTPSMASRARRAERARQGHARAGTRRRARPPGLRQDRLLRAVPDDPAARPGDAVRRSKRVQHQPGCCADPDNGAVPALLRDRARSRHHHRGSGRPRRDEPTSPGPEHPDHQPHSDPDVDPLRRRPVPGCPGSTGRRPGPTQHRQGQRIPDDDVRGHGTGHRLQRVDQSPRPHQRAQPADPAGAGDLVGPGRPDRPGDSAARPAGRTAHGAPHGRAMATVRRARTVAAPGDRSQQVDPPATRTCGSGHRPAAIGHPEPRPPGAGRPS